MGEEKAVENGNGFHGDNIHKKKKKKKRVKHEAEEAAEETEEATNKKKKNRKKQRKEGMKEKPTVSIAIAGFIIDNAQSLELATRLAGQIARAATIFRADEVVVFDSKPQPTDDCVATTSDDGNGSESGARFLVRILQYLETPRYLRRRLFPMYNSLKFMGFHPPIDAPHHVRKHEWPHTVKVNGYY